LLCAVVLLGGALVGCTEEQKGLTKVVPAAPARTRTENGPIKVGILHSLTGTMSISETAVVDATKLAIDEVNAAGGINGRKLEVIVADGKSDDSTFAAEAERLITQDRTSVVFGCWTSACRKTVKPIFEKYDHLLFYPLQYEGLEYSKNIIYTGATPNQQILPAVKWAHEKLGPRVFLVGSDYVFPRTANEIIKDRLKQLGGTVVGEEYVLLGSQSVDAVVRKIAAAKPSYILNTINGDTNVAFFKALRAKGITPQKVPTISFSISEAELATMGAKDLAGHYASWNYFQSVPTPANQIFVKAFQDRYGSHRVTGDPMEAAYFGVHLWALAARSADSALPEAVRKALPAQRFVAPEGPVYIDPENNHTAKTVRIGKILANGQFEMVWMSETPLSPVPYPSTRTRPNWVLFLDSLYSKWNRSWANPGKS
jgi:urea transport system substrate-binding protein